MSKRYGRNQKRKAREQISKLERHLGEYTEAYSRDTSMLRKSLRDAQSKLETVKEALGPHFIGFSPEVFDRRVFELGEAYDFTAPLPEGSVDMRSMVYRSFNDSLRHNHQLHFRVQLAGGHVGYAISEPALRRTPADYLARMIGHEMARLLVRDLRKAGVRG